MHIQQQASKRPRHRADCKCNCARETLVDVGLADRPEFRSAVANRDVAAMYRLLQRYGFSQRAIAFLTGQSQPEIHEVLHGRRVVSYDLLLQIADGLGVPRGWMGLAYDTPDGQPAQQ
jgi:hypothetical protein